MDYDNYILKLCFAYCYLTCKFELFSHSSDEGGKFLCVQLVWKPIMAQYASYTSVMWTPDACSAHTLRVYLSVK